LNPGALSRYSIMAMTIQRRLENEITVSQKFLMIKTLG
jgi:hypothetical protein